MRPLPRRLAFVVVLALALLIPGSAAAFPLSDCTLELTSLDATGNALDSATGGTNDASFEDPFLVDWEGTVLWNGTMGSQVIKNHGWHVDVFHFPTPVRGGDPNEGGDTSGEGSVDVSANAPFRLTGSFYVSGEIKGEGGSCTGGGWFKIVGDPVGTVPFFLALALVVIGAIMIALGGGRGSWLLGLVGGFLFGLGVAMLLIGFSIMPIGSPTVAATLALGLLIGALAAWSGRSRMATQVRA
jgi:hypothetical protein